MNILLHCILFRKFIPVLIAALLTGYTAKAQVSITCPTDISVPNDLGQCGAVVTYTPPVGTGSGTGITTSLTTGLSSGSNFSVGTTQVTYTVSNNEGDSESCSFFVTVNDTEIPDMACPADIYVDANPMTCEAIVFFDLPTATDNCGIFDVFQFGGLPSGSSFPVGENFVDFQASDINGNSDFCRIKIIVQDVSDPIITCPGDLTFQIYTSCDTVINYVAPIGSDGCTPNTTVLTSGNGPGGTFSVGTTTETYTVTDLHGNAASCSFDINIIDAAPPAITCPGDITVNVAPGTCEAIVSFADAVATDNCTVASVIQTSGPASGSLFPAGNTIVEFTATDASGNQSSCSFTVTVSENEIPQITCIADITVSNDPGLCGAIVNYTPPEGSDNCQGVLTSLTSGIGSGNLFPLGITTETYTVTDASGNTASCSFQIEVIDGEAPSIDCPSDIIVSNDPGQCDAVVTFLIPTASDNCNLISIVQTAGPISGSTFSLDTTSVEYTATDAAGNTSTCVFNIIVQDTTAPSITCPGDINITIPGNACSTILTYPDPILSDNCSGTTFSLISGPASGDVVNAGIYTIELQAEDLAGNTTTCTFTATVAETSLPIIVCPADTIVAADPGTCEAIVNFPLPTATDSCSAVTVSQTSGPVSGSLFPAGSTTVQFTATDAFGNTATCSYSITVDDGVAPEIICPGNIVVSTDPGLCSGMVTYPLPVATDNCSIASVTLTQGLPSGSTFPSGETTITYEATDISGNSATCSFTITVEDNENPELTCPSDMVKNIPAGDCSTIVLFAPPTASDNCGVVSVIQTQGFPSGGNFPVGENQLTFVASDAAGNTDTCTFTISVIEPTPPEITCPANISVSADTGLCSAIVTYATPVGTDGCPGASTQLTAGLGSGAAFPLGTTTETYTVTDASGNTISCSFTVTVADTELPEITCPTNITVEADAGLCSAIVNYPIPSATDNCDNPIIPVLTSGLNSGDVFPVGVSTVEYSATDLAGNVSTCTFTVTVTDSVSPTLTCPADILVNAASGDCDAVVTYPAPVISDNCSGSTLTLLDGLASGSAFPVGETIVTYQAEDPSGNTTQCSFTVTIAEDIPPTIICPADIVVANDPTICGAIVTFTPPVGTDNCGGATTELVGGIAPGSLFPVGTTIVTYQVIDISGNQTTCSFNVTVNDTEPPAFVCPENDTLEVSAGLCGVLYNFAPPEVTDNCTDILTVNQTQGPASGTVLTLGDTLFEFTTTDAVGNTATCSYIITVVDTQAPIFDSCPSDTTIAVDANNCEALVVFDVPTATDNCDFTMQQTAGPANNTVQTPGSYVFEFTATDDSGNSSICEFTVIVADTIAPLIQCPDSIQTCAQNPEFEIPEATDNCTIDEVIQTAGPESGTEFPDGITIIEFTAYDISGNSSVCHLVIEVLDKAPRPVLGDDRNICAADSTVLIGSNPAGASPSWTQIEGSGLIHNPFDATTPVSGLQVGKNTFVYSLNPNNGCEIKSDTISIYVEPGVVVYAGEDHFLFEGDAANLNAAASPPDGEYLWQPGGSLSCTSCANPVAEPAETTVYYVTYTSPLGCSTEDSVQVRITKVLPNTITPDNDGVNDVWHIPGIENYPDAVVLIYNRWGNEVFASTGYHAPWDGTRNGEALPTGSYYYIINYNTEGKESLNGALNIIR